MPKEPFATVHDWRRRRRRRRRRRHSHSHSHGSPALHCHCPPIGGVPEVDDCDSALCGNEGTCAESGRARTLAPSENLTSVAEVVALVTLQASSPQPVHSGARRGAVGETRGGCRRVRGTVRCAAAAAAAAAAAHQVTNTLDSSAPPVRWTCSTPEARAFGILCIGWKRAGRVSGDVGRWAERSLRRHAWGCRLTMSVDVGGRWLGWVIWAVCGTATAEAASNEASASARVTIVVESWLARWAVRRRRQHGSRTAIRQLAISADLRRMGLYTG